MIIFILINFNTLSYLTKKEFNQKCSWGVSNMECKDKNSNQKYNLNENCYKSVSTTASQQRSDDYSEGRIMGSFCPTQTQYKTLTIKGFPKVDLWMIGKDTYSNSDGIIRCSGSHVGQEYTETFYAHRCYPFYIYLWSSCSYSSSIYVKYDGSELTTSNAVSCFLNDCLPFYWGSNCQNKVDDFDDDKNCKVSLGLSGTGKCTDCYGVTEIQKHCRPSTSAQYLTLSKKEVFSDSSYVDKGTLTTTEFSPNDDYYYSRYKIEGYVVLPFEGTFTFKLTTDTPATLKIGSQTKGQSDPLHCGPFSEQTYEISITGEVGPQKIIIEIDSGCCLDNPYVKLEWKHTKKNSYHLIPELYLYH